MPEISYGSPTLDGALEFAQTKNTAVPLATNQNGAGTATIGTVPASKVWRITGVWLAGCINNEECVPKLQLNGVTAMALKLQAGASTFSPMFGSINWDWSACPVLTAAQTATIVNPDAGMDTHGGITYVEEDA